MNRPRINLMRQLSVIQETNIEDSNIEEKDFHNITSPLFDRLGSCDCIDQKEEINDTDLQIIFETTGKLIANDWLNQ